MIYLYAYTNHKNNLEELRRTLALYNALKEQNLECEILVNEYRAQLLLKDWGLPLATTIETIKDIDAVAKVDDIIVIDSPETIEGKIKNYPNKFKAVIYLNSSFKDVEFNGAKVINLFLDKNYIFSNLEQTNKSKNSIFIYGDSDYEKTIIKNSEIFKNKDLDLYWGIYFFVKYEDSLKDIFNEIIESEDYYECIKDYQRIVTSSLQIALEAKANKCHVEFLELKNLSTSNKEILAALNISIINNINKNYNLTLEKDNIYNINNKLINIINSYV
jgi:hypothetical protein